jgi:hypothetical protein
VDAVKVVQITVEYEAACLSCDELVRVGTRANYVPGVGVWHVTCPRPKNLALYWAEAQKRRRLGL